MKGITLPLGMQYSDIRHAIGQLVRDMTSASGTVEVTGVGFRPKKVRLTCIVDGSTAASWGSDIQTKQETILAFGAAAAFSYNGAQTLSIYLDKTGGNYQTAYINSFTNDGFVLTFVKIGLPTGSAAIHWEAER